MSPTKKSRPHIPLVPDYDESQVPTVEHTRKEVVDGIEESISEKIPRLIQNASAYFILFFFSKFTQVRHDFNWNSGARLFQKFAQHLDGTHRLDWQRRTDRITAAHRTVAAFNTQIRELKARLLGSYSYTDQIEYLRSLKKPPDVSPSMFAQQLQNAEYMATQLPDANGAQGFTDAERKSVFLHAMPIAWQLKFDDANMRLATEEFADIIHYMDILYANYPYVKPKSKDEANDRADFTHRDNYQRNNNSSNRPNDSKSSALLRDDDPCPLSNHYGHTWGDCRERKIYRGQANTSGTSSIPSDPRTSGPYTRFRHESNVAESNVAEANGSAETKPTSPAESHFIEPIYREPTLIEVLNDPDCFFSQDGIQEELESAYYDG